MDSAVDSLEESPTDLQKQQCNTRPSTSSNYYHPADLISGGSSEQAWDSGLSSTADTNNPTQTLNNNLNNNSCCSCNTTTLPKSSKNGAQEDW